MSSNSSAFTKVLKNLLVLTSGRAVQSAVRAAHAGGRSVVLVPTMGALHAGHQALIREGRKRSSEVWVSIFVNPTQFDDPADLNGYPRQFEADCKLAQEAGATGVFAPSLAEVYPDGFVGQFSTLEVNYGRLTSELEGQDRPGHFDGVVQVVRRLFELVEPDVALFGEKDFQQLAVIADLARRENLGVEVVSVPTVRGEEGLALSSRNVRLSQAARKAALLLSAKIKAVARAPQPLAAADIAFAELADHPLIAPAYFAVVESDTFAPYDPENPRPARVLVAAEVDGIRLIDNVALEGVD